MLQARKSGYQEAHFLANGLRPGRLNAISNVTLIATSDVPEGMIYVPGVKSYNLSLDGQYLTTATVQPFYLDKFEVTNRQFKECVDQGGYLKRELWKEPFPKEGREIPWESAMKDFVTRQGNRGRHRGSSTSFPQARKTFL